MLRGYWHFYSDKVFSCLSWPGEGRMGQRKKSALYTPNTTLHLNHFFWPKYVDMQGLTFDPNFVLHLYWKQVWIWMLLQIWKCILLDNLEYLCILIMKIVNFIYCSTRQQKLFRVPRQTQYLLLFWYLFSFLPLPYVISPFSFLWPLSSLHLPSDGS